MESRFSVDTTIDADIQYEASKSLMPVSYTHLEAQDVLERVAPAGERLVRQAEHQVEREVGKARLARADDGHARLLVIMRAAEALEHVVLIGLHADGEDVYKRQGHRR